MNRARRPVADRGPDAGGAGGDGGDGGAGLLLAAGGPETGSDVFDGDDAAAMLRAAGFDDADAERLSGLPGATPERVAHAVHRLGQAQRAGVVRSAFGLVRDQIVHRREIDPTWAKHRERRRAARREAVETLTEAGDAVGAACARLAATYDPADPSHAPCLRVLRAAEAEGLGPLLAATPAAAAMRRAVLDELRAG